MNEREANAACALLDEVIERAEDYAAALGVVDPFRPEPTLRALAALKKSHQQWMKTTGDDYPDAFEPELLPEALEELRAALKEYAKELRQMQSQAVTFSELLHDAMDYLEQGDSKGFLTSGKAAGKILDKWSSEPTAIDEAELDTLSVARTEFATAIEWAKTQLGTEIKDWRDLEVEYEEEGLAPNRRGRRGR